jgi:hypothetical protein
MEVANGNNEEDVSRDEKASSAPDAGAHNFIPKNKYCLLWLRTT